MTSGGLEDDFATAIMGPIKFPENSKDDIISAFKIFDGENTGFIGVDDLRQVLDVVESKFTDKEKTALLERI